MIRAPRCSVAPMPCGALAGGVDRSGVRVRIARLPRRERNAAVGAVIHVLAEQATVDGASDAPGYLPGFGILPAESVRALASRRGSNP